MKRFLVTAMALILSACASYPDEVVVADGTELTSFVEANKLDSKLIGKTVRWSGIIAKISNEKTLTKLDVLYYPANSNGRPQTKDEPVGRFRVVVDGFVDPAVYRQGKAITALGQLKQPETAKIGEYEYSYPTLISKNIHLWQNINPTQQVHFNYGWQSAYPSWYWRGGIRHVYIVGDKTRPSAQVAPKPLKKQQH